MIIEFNHPTVLIFEKIKIIPGANTIPLNTWLKMRSHPMIKKMIETELITPYDEEDETEKISGESIDHVNETKVYDPLDDLLKLKVNQAQKIIKNIYDIELLRRWTASDKETRSPVNNSLKKQIKLLEEKPEFRNRDEYGAVEGAVGGGVEEMTLRPDFSAD